MHNSEKKDILISLGLFLTGVITRIPFASRLFNYWDGAEFAIALEKYSPREGFPCPVGHFLYVMLVKGINLFINDAHRSFIIQSVIGTSLFVVMIYWLGRAIFDRLCGIWAALIVLSAPWFWFYSITTVPNMFVGFLTAASALCFYCAIFNKDRRSLYWGSISFALLCGMRHQDFLFILPIYLWALLNAKWKGALKALGLFTGICLAWFIPMVLLSGGLKEYSQILYTYSHSSKISESIFSVPLNKAKTNFTIKIKILLLVYSIGILPLFYQLYPFFNLTNITKDRKARFLLVLILPAVIFWLVFFGHNAGYFMSSLTGLTIYLSWAIFASSKEITALLSEKITFFKFNMLKKSEFLSWLFVILLVIFNSFIFFYDFTPQEKAPVDMLYQNWSQVKNKDIMQEEKIKYIKSYMDPQATAIITTTWFFMQVMYYLPEFYVYQYDFLKLTGEQRLVRYAYRHSRRYLDEKENFRFPKDITKIILFDEQFQCEKTATGDFKFLDIGKGYHFCIMEWPPKDKINLIYEKPIY